MPQRPRSRSEPMLPCRIRLSDGRMFEGALPAARHRRVHLGMLHAGSVGFVEMGRGIRTDDGEIRWDDRGHVESFLHLGGNDRINWLDVLDGRMRSYLSWTRCEVMVAPSVRSRPSEMSDAVAYTNWLWVDVDRAAAVPRLRRFLEDHPAHLRIEPGDGIGEHVYWRLARPLPAAELNPRSGGVHEWIDRANLRLAAAIGEWEDDTAAARLLGADVERADRSQLMELAGAPNHEHQRWARIVEADFALPPYSLKDLVGDLPDMHDLFVQHRLGAVDGDPDPDASAPVTQLVS
ncbi:hypothetical protein [Conexibacter sp. CPCC 206217]|uniref:hypothetical protein n=1 Tax=Conexibacter sp. CPCC 206217 TaxID=3064574 RepID=UPI002725A303|nr:hypothetical protein [Conexibacter sp. CPCC 206217]MDO8208976.1 hypothetical protein [Conexibacter sp. CPCC 206217]